MDACIGLYCFLKSFFNRYHFFLKDFSIRNSSSNKGESLFFYCQQMCKKCSNCFLFQGSPLPSSGIFQAWEAKYSWMSEKLHRRLWSERFRGAVSSPELESWLFCGQKHSHPCLQLAHSPGSREDTLSPPASSSEVISSATQEGKEGRDGRAENLQVKSTLNWSRMKPCFPPKLQVFEMLTGVFGVGN